MEVPVQEFRSAAEQALWDAYGKAVGRLPGAATPSVAEMRAAAIKAFARAGLPHRRVEAWKYTDLRSRLDHVPPLATGAGPAVDETQLATALGAGIAAFPAYRVVVAGGALSPALSDLDGLRDAGVEAGSLAEWLAAPPAWLAATLGQVNPQDDDAVLALNTALMTGGVALHLREGLTLDKPVHIVHLDAPNGPALSVTRNVIVAEDGASATVLESYGTLGRAGQLRNAATEVRLGDKSAIQHIKLQREALETIHLDTWLATLGSGARYNAFQVSAGASLARNQLYVAFDGEGAAADLSGVTLGRGNQHCDTTLVVDHRVPKCESRELYKLVLDDQARGIFQGKVTVAPDAQKTDGKQMAQALLLSEAAEFDAKPELEIYADDVVCGHGATSGQIDEDLLFYLRSRGLPEPQARALLIQAFVGEALEALEHEGLRDVFASVAADWLGAPAA